MPVRGLGAKNVVFCGMRTRSTAAARVVGDRDRASSRIAAVAAPLSTSAATRGASWRYCQRRVREARDDERLDDGGVGRGDGGMLVGERGGARVGARDGEREAAARRRGRARARRASRRRARRRRRACSGPRRATSNASASRARRSTPAGTSMQAVDGLDAELVVDELDHERHDRGRAAGRRSPAARELVAVVAARSRSGGDRRPARAARRRRRARIAAMRRGVVDAPRSRGARRRRRRRSRAACRVVEQRGEARSRG